MAPLRSWLEIDPKSHFSINNIPFGIISTAASPQPHAAVAVGKYALDLQAFTRGNGFAKLSIIQPHQAVFSQTTLNAFAALGRPIHRVVREYLQSVLLEKGPFAEVLQGNDQLQKEALIPLEKCTMHLPMQIGDYTVRVLTTDCCRLCMLTLAGLLCWPESCLQRWRSLPRSGECSSTKLQAPSSRLSRQGKQRCSFWYTNTTTEWSNSHDSCLRSQETHSQSVQET